MLALALALCANPGATVQVTANGHMQTAVCVHRSEMYGTYFLTAKHGIAKPWTVHAGGRDYSGTWVIVAKDCDVALLWHRDAAIPIGVSHVGGDSVGVASSVGFDRPLTGGGWSPAGSHAVRAWQAPCVAIGGEVHAYADSGPGRSGGGLFDRGGSLVGVCSYRHPLGRTVFVPGSRIQAFLGRARAKGFAPFWR